MFFRRGKTSSLIVDLINDIRFLMSPYTANNLKESKKNQLRDFLAIGPSLSISHFIILSQTTIGTNMRIIRIPHGPTLTFRIKSYCLMRDITKMQNKPHSPGSEFKHSPLVVLNNFSSGEDHIKLMAAMFQNMFPSIDVNTIKLNECRRVLLINYESNTKTIEIRHYFVNAAPVGLSKATRRVIRGKLSNLKNVNDISDYVFKSESLSDSEAEDPPEAKVLLPQSLSGRGNRESQKSALRLKEIGPRITLQLIKIEEEFCGGKVIFHEFVNKTPEEAITL